MPMPWWKHRLIGSMALLVGLATAHFAVADECLSPSPSIRAGKDPYAAIAPRELTPAEREGLTRLFKSLAGDWQGTADTFFCRSTADPADKEREHNTVRAKVEVDYNNNLALRADLFSPQRRSASQETLRFYLNNRRLRIDHDTGAGDVELQTVTDQGLTFFYRRVAPLGAFGGSARREYFVTLQAAGKGFSIEQIIYVQGKLSSGYTWRFER
ncbi:MAG: hypothetical protein WAU91_06575 [Desulfatitalea sp.]